MSEAVVVAPAHAIVDCDGEGRAEGVVLLLQIGPPHDATRPRIDG